jgi:hypothetical protein
VLSNTYIDTWILSEKRAPAFGTRSISNNWCSMSTLELPKPSTRNFTFFPQLPTELRRAVWKFALPEPRVLSLDLTALDDYQWPSEIRFVAEPGWRSPTSDFHHGNMLPCREALEVFNENYRKLELQGLPLNGSFICSKGIQRDCSTTVIAPKELVDLRRDTLVIKSRDIEYMNELGISLDLSRVENLAISNNFKDILPATIVSLATSFAAQMCPRLTALKIVMGENFDREEWGSLHLLNINLDFKDMLVSQFGESWEYDRNCNRPGGPLPLDLRNGMVESWYQEAMAVERNFKKIMNEDSHWKRVNFNVSMLATKFYNNNKFFYAIAKKPEEHPLYEKALQHPNCTYYITADSPPGPESDLLLKIIELDFVVHAYADGTLQTLIEDMPRLFEEL